MKHATLALYLFSSILPVFAQESRHDAPKAVYITKIEQGILPCEEFSPWIGKPITDVSLTCINGDEIKLSSLRGKVVYVNIWFTGCPPCVKEIPELNRLFSLYGNNKNVEIISISTDDTEKLKQFLKQNPINFTVTTATFDIIEKIAMPKKDIGFPTHLILDRAGNLVAASRGGSSNMYNELKYSIDKALSLR